MVRAMMAHHVWLSGSEDKAVLFSLDTGRVLATVQPKHGGMIWKAELSLVIVSWRVSTASSSSLIGISGQSSLAGVARRLSRKPGIIREFVRMPNCGCFGWKKPKGGMDMFLMIMMVMVMSEGERIGFEDEYVRDCFGE